MRRRTRSRWIARALAIVLLATGLTTLLLSFVRPLEMWLYLTVPPLLVLGILTWRYPGHVERVWHWLYTLDAISFVVWIMLMILGTGG